MLPVWYLNEQGLAAVKARAAELMAYLDLCRAMRAASARWGL